MGKKRGDATASLGRSFVKYFSGEEIQMGDRVLYCGEPGVIELVADKLVGDLDIDWHVKELGPGVLIREPKVFGRVYINDTQDDEDLVFVSRNEGQ